MKNFSIKFYKNVIYFLIVVLFFSSCQNSYNDEYNKISDNEITDNSTYFVVNNNSSRSVLPEYKNDSFNVYVLKGSLDDGEEKDFGTFNSYNDLCKTKFEVTEGVWTLSLTAQRYETVYSDSITTTIKNGANSVSFELKMEKLDTKEGKGSIQFNLNVPNEVEKVIYLLKDFYNGLILSGFEKIETTVNNGVSVFNAQDVPSGTYYIDAVLYDKDGNKLNDYRTVATVCDSVISKGVFTITAVNQIYNITFAAGHYSFEEGYVFKASYTRFDTDPIILPAKDNLNTALQFLGWYLNRDCTGEPVTEILPSEQTDYVLYPKWGNELTCTVSELEEYITDFYNTEIIVHITDLNPEIDKIGKCLKKNSTVNVSLDLDACTELTRIDDTFSNLNNLTAISIPENITNLYSSAFSDCKYLKEINFNVKHYQNSSSYWRWLNDKTGCESDIGGVIINIGAGVEEIPSYFVYFDGNDCIKKINFPENSALKKIGESAFEKVAAIEEITLGGNLENVGSSAFYGCKNLKTVKITKNDISLGYSPFDKTNIENIYFFGNLTDWLNFCNTNYTSGYSGSSKINCNTTDGSNLYLNNVLLTDVYLDDKDCIINPYAIQNIKSITSITIGEAVESIDIKSISSSYRIPNLKTINFNAINCKDISSYSYIFGKTIGSSDGITVNIGNKVKRIPAYLFQSYYNNSDFNLNKLVFKDNSVCSEIGRSALSSLSKLKSITLPKSITTLQSYVFSDTALENVYYEGSLEDWYTKIEFYTESSNPLYYGEANLYVNKNELVETLDFSDEITDLSIQQHAFSGCKSLKKVVIPENVTLIPKYFIDYAYYVEELDYNPSASINFTTEYSRCFLDMGTKSPNGVKLVIGKNVTKVPDYFFCQSSADITELTFEDNSKCKEIGKQAFYYLTSLKKITIPESVEKINSAAFSGDSRSSSWGSYLEEINFNANITDSNHKNEGFSNAGQYYEKGLVLNIGPNVKVIPEKLFYNACIKTVVFEGTGISEIRENAFYGHTINEVKYPGTQRQWQEITFEKENSNPCYAGANLYINGELYTEVTFDTDITEMPNATYAGVKSITKITIPEGITKLGKYTFWNCINVTQLNYNSISSKIFGSSRLFYNVGHNTEGVTVNIGDKVIEIPDEIFSESYSKNYSIKITCVNFPDNCICKEIGDSAFYGIISLKEITIPKSIIKFGSRAFGECDALENVYYLGSKVEWEEISFKDEKSSPCCNGASLYFQGNKVTSVAFPEGTLTTPAGAYSGCKDITSVSLPSTLKTINNYIFYKCTGLTSITIPESVEEILDSPFYGCTGLSEIIYLPSKLSKNTSYPGDMFKEAGKTSSTGGCTLTIGSNVVEISESMFREARNINTINFQENSKLEVIKRSAFEYSGLTSIIIPDSVKELESDSFYGSHSLESVTIGSGVKKISSRSFSNCENLKQVTFKDTENWYKNEYSYYSEFISEDKIDVSDSQEMAQKLIKEWNDYYLFKK
ncbi:Leucine rich repeat-containing protein [Treponema bryantii]|uniref:Leucine rich repeat-containing protein n=1 Tax=Treponema bryantii TaxID=163 RepID=A0A1H9AP65_9SPIR|nr:leucine-rich repeat domain-containing protein [Treponema bryantii]SEP78564.1 Leucine rich repeat-containing protein [Treponema bryantii]